MAVGIEALFTSALGLQALECEDGRAGYGAPAHRLQADLERNPRVMRNPGTQGRNPGSGRTGRTQGQVSHFPFF